MDTANGANSDIVSVETTDELRLAIDAAHARAREVFKPGHVTLIGNISAADWASWDGSDEKALISDMDGLEGYDVLDDECVERAA